MKFFTLIRQKYHVWRRLSYKIAINYRFEPFYPTIFLLLIY